MEQTRKSPAGTGLNQNYLSRNHTTVDPVGDFTSAMHNAGIGAPEHVIADGELHRFKGNNDKAVNSWYLLHLDGWPAGAFGSWRLNISQTWRAGGKPPSFAERAQFAKMLDEARRRQHVKREATQAKAAVECRAWWQASPPAQCNHPYLLRKHVTAQALRQSRGLLLVPLVDADGLLWNIQTIANDGTKRFQRGGRITGLFSVVGDLNQPASLLICEGWATAATLHSESSITVLAAMNAGNLQHVAKVARSQWPDADIVICGDDDRGTPGNPGRSKATQAAQAIGARLAFPDFATGEPGTDFNDYAINRLGVAA